MKQLWRFHTSEINQSGLDGRGQDAECDADAFVLPGASEWISAGEDIMVAPTNRVT